MFVGLFLVILCFWEVVSICPARALCTCSKQACVAYESLLVLEAAASLLVVALVLYSAYLPWKLMVCILEAVKEGLPKKDSARQAQLCALRKISRTSKGEGFGLCLVHTVSSNTQLLPPGAGCTSLPAQHGTSFYHPMQAKIQDWSSRALKLQHAQPQL
eukprot:1147367-Pelagomonas_calceolata.AAC.1